MTKTVITGATGAVEADVFDERALERAFAGAGAVVNLLTHIRRSPRWVCPAPGTRTTAFAATRRPRSPARGLQADALARHAAAAVVAGLRAPAGVYNVADTDPPTRAEIDAAPAAAVGRPGLQPPEFELELVERSQRVSSRRLREATGWAPRVGAGTEGWHRLVERAIPA